MMQPLGKMCNGWEGVQGVCELISVANLWWCLFFRGEDDAADPAAAIGLSESLATTTAVPLPNSFDYWRNSAKSRGGASSPILHCHLRLLILSTLGCRRHWTCTETTRTFLKSLFSRIVLFSCKWHLRLQVVWLLAWSCSDFAGFDSQSAERTSVRGGQEVVGTEGGATVWSACQTSGLICLIWASFPNQDFRFSLTVQMMQMFFICVLYPQLFYCLISFINVILNLIVL